MFEVVIDKDEFDIWQIWEKQLKISPMCSSRNFVLVWENKRGWIWLCLEQELSKLVLIKEINFTIDTSCESWDAGLIKIKILVKWERKTKFFNKNIT
jgi:hypothetical protein